MKLAINNILVPQNSKTLLSLKPQIVTKKTIMYYTNCHRTNHNVETCRVKRKEEYVLVVYEVTTQQIQVQRAMKFFCHICGDTRHKIINCLKFNDMKNMFKKKGVKTSKKPYVVEPKVANPSVHVMDVNILITMSKLIEKQNFQGHGANQEKLCYWLGRRVEITTIFCQDNMIDASKRPTKKFESKGKP